MKQASSQFPPLSLAPIISSLPPDSNTLISAKIRSNGAPILHFSNGTAYSYDAELRTFVKLSDKWWAEGSDAWPGRQRGSATASTDKAVGAIENTIIEVTRDVDLDASKKRPSWWSAAMTLGHLESRMHAARVLESPLEYKQSLLVYAQRLATEGFRGKAEELIKELFGPTYWCV